MVSMTRLNLSSLFHRITLNRLSFSFFLFSFVTCFTQGILHSFLYSVDSEYNDLLSGITKHAGTPDKNYTYLEGQYQTGYWDLRSKGSGELTLIMCNDVWKIGCFDAFKTGSSSNVTATNIEQDAILRGQILAQRHETVFRISSDGGKAPNETAVTLTSPFGSVPLNRQCTQILTYPQQHMHTALREDLTLVIFQFWLLGMGIYAMIKDSVPHILAPLFARILLLGWSSYAIMRTHHQKLAFYQLVDKAGSPCSLKLFSAYFDQRMQYEIADVILNTTACVTCVYLSWTLLKVYNNRSFKCVGAPEAIMKLHKYLLALLAVLHLALFVIINAISLWIDQLFNSYINHASEHTPAYLACFIVTCVLVVPWIASGYNATIRERHNIMVAFVCIGSLFLFGWSLMFWSQVFRWTFLMWPYLGCYTVTSFLLIIASIVLGVVCRLNFGKGLMQYLRAENLLAASNFKAEVFEHDAEKALAYEEYEPASPISISSISKQNPSLTTIGLPILSPGVVISPTSRLTKEEREMRGEDGPQLPIPTYYPTFTVPILLEPKRG